MPEAPVEKSREHSLPTPWEPGEAAWHPGHPFRPRLSAFRRWGMFALLLFLALIIGGYLYITDSNRVQRIAQNYLTEVLGGPVRVGHVKLSIFEGLQVDDVEVRVDDTDRPDAVIFRARSFDIQYDFRALLRGDIAATVIRAIDPHVQLTENTDNGTWNYQRMVERAMSRAQKKDENEAPIVLPEIILRNATIDYSQICTSKLVSSGSFAIEGKLMPSTEPGKYFFDMQSRGPTDETGPTLSGSFAMNTGKVAAKLRNFTFGKDVRSMLPTIVRDWWDRHDFAGQISTLDLVWDGSVEGKPDKSFSVDARVDGVQLTIRPEEWRSKEENGHVAFMQELLQNMRTIEHGGAPAASAPTASTKHLPIDALSNVFDQVPIVVDNIAGDFSFTQDTIELKNVTGRIETTPLKIHGKVEDYADGPDAGFDMTVESGQDNIVIPHQPRWIGALPRPVRKIYDWFKPEGSAALTFHVAKDKATDKDPDPDLRYAGKIEILNGNFQFIKFPYPARNAAGTIEFAQDSTKNLDYLDMSVHAYGAANGPNRDSMFTLKGHMSPLTSNVKVDITIDGSNISDEPLLAAAYPGNVRKAIQFFDADGKGQFPKYHGKFHADVMRPYGEDTDWIVNIDIDVDNAAGKLVAFPYPLDHVTGSAHIRHGYVDIENFHMQRAASTLDVHGRVSWADNDDDDDDDHYDHNKVTQVKLTQDIHVTAHGVPIDEQFLAAIPGGKRAWLDKLGITGNLDVDGKVFTAKSPNPDDDDVTYDLALTLHDGVLHPPGGNFIVNQLAGKLRVTPTSLLIDQVAGKRLTADIATSGKIEWPDDAPRADLHIEASALPLDAALYHTLPKSVRESWDAVKPVGTTDMALDLRLGYDTAPSIDNHPDVHLILSPRQLSITPTVMPYRLDNLKGTIEVTDENVTIPALAATHGKAGVKLAGRGTLLDRPVWDLAINAADIAFDDEFHKALPATVADLVKSMDMTGAFDLFCPNLSYRAGPGAKGEDNPDIDFSSTFILKNTSMNAGVPLAGMSGQVTLNGAVRGGAVSDLTGSVDLTNLKIADRSARNFHLDLAKTPGAPELHIDHMQSEFAGGEIAGQLTLTFPPRGPSKYTLALILRNADIKQMAGRLDENNIVGQMNASLNLEGAWNNDASRRGRGDVTVSGKNMVHIPLLLGLLQVTNLTLPTNNPFNEGTARYSVDGKRVTFEAIQLTAPDNLLRGSGWLDFGNKAVRMSFYTENPALARVPVVGDIASGFKQELLQFQVRGTLEDPKVSASTFNTVTTTVDEVFKVK